MEVPFKSVYKCKTAFCSRKNHQNAELRDLCMGQKLPFKRQHEHQADRVLILSLHED